jgi:hypothetical protein
MHICSLLRYLLRNITRIFSLPYFSHSKTRHALECIGYILVGYPFWLTGANEPIIEKHISKCQKIRNKNSACTFWYIMFVHKFSKEKNIFYVLYKKDKFMYEHITIHRTYFYLFYWCHIKCSFLSKTCVPI